MAWATQNGELDVCKWLHDNFIDGDLAAQVALREALLRQPRPRRLSSGPPEPGGQLFAGGIASGVLASLFSTSHMNHFAQFF